jgi:predicted glycoside hydrolase/deacetylase ChbG (UPF0249 family)
MNQSEASSQVENFFRRLGEKPSFFDEKNFVQARIGEALIGFEYDEAEELLSSQALIYRFRKEPQDKVLDAVFNEESDDNNGGGRVVFNSENFAFYLQKDFVERLDDTDFYNEINQLAQASLLWSSEILMQAAGKANR